MSLLWFSSRDLTSTLNAWEKKKLKQKKVKIHSQILLTHNALVYFHKHVSFMKYPERRKKKRTRYKHKKLWCKFITKKFKFSRIKHDFLCNCDGAWRASEVKHLVAFKIQNTNLFTNSPVSNSGRQATLRINFKFYFAFG